MISQVMADYTISIDKSEGGEKILFLKHEKDIPNVIEFKLDVPKLWHDHYPDVEENDCFGKYVFDLI